MHSFYVAPSAKEWILWAEENNLNQTVVKYICSDEKRFDTANPRSWSNLGLALNSLKKNTNIDLTHRIAVAFVGSVAAEAFVAWLSRESHNKSKCDCGADVARTTHALWCSTFKKLCH